MTLDRKKIVITILVLLFLSAILAVFIFWQKSSNRTKITLSDVSIGEQQKVSAFDEIYQEALARGDISGCLSLLDDGDKDLCIELIAVAKIDENLCSDFTDQKASQPCRDRVIFKKAAVAENPTICSSIVGDILRSDCIVNILKSGDYTQEECDRLDKAEKNICLDQMFFNQAVKNKDISLCANINPVESRQECIGTLVQGASDKSVCQKLNAETETICLDQINYKTALKNVSNIPCVSIVDVVTKEECLKSVNDLLDNDHDGLTNGQEEYFKTDLNDTDTDGDGYTDGEEARSGFDPNGSGRLNF